EDEQWEYAARLSGAEQMLWRSIPAEIPAPVVALHRKYWDATRNALGPDRWATCHDEGVRLDRSAAVALALGEEPVLPRAARTRPTAGSSALTDRQLEVARLVSEGMTDRQIAARL